MVKLNKIEETLLGLLRVALGNADVASVVDSGVDWQEVMALAERQGVLGVAFDGVQKLPKEKLPDMDTLMDWLGQSSYMETVYEEYTEALSGLARIVSNEGLRMMVLKGYGCSLNYPNPQHRPTGDIDIFILNRQGVHDKGYVRFLNQILDAKVGSTVDYESSHHAQFNYKGYLVENHSTILDVDSHKSSVWLNGLLEDLAKDSKPIDVNGQQVWLPSAKFNSIHLLRHMANDFATVKTTLRHVLDWATFVATHDVDWNFVHDVAHKSNMTRFLDAINSICVEYLGYPSEMFPLCSQLTPHTSQLRDRVLSDILHPEFSDDIPPMTNKLAYGWAKTKRMWKNRWKHRIVYKESLLDSFLWKSINRLNHQA